MRMLTCTSLTTAILATALLAQSASQHPSMPPGMTHDQHQRQTEKDAELKRRGAAAMGFGQDTTTHHFHLGPDGGAIEVTVNDSADPAGLERVRTHLRDIAAAFAAGDFAKPLTTHGEMPPGIAVMQARKDHIRYVYEDVPAGGRVRMTTSDPPSVSAIHDFLRYQIREHSTGDSLDVTSRRMD